MIIDNNTELILINKHAKQDPEVCLVSFFTEYANFERNVKSTMVSPTIEYDYIEYVLKHEKIKAKIYPSDTIKPACLYLATCCFIGKTEKCKLLLENILDLYHINIYDPAIPRAYGDPKEILHYLVKTIIDKYSDQLEKIAKDLEII